MDKSEIAIFISLGSLLVSLGGLLFGIYSSLKARRIERAHKGGSTYTQAEALEVKEDGWLKRLWN